MANTTITPNMSLIVPTVGQDPGPDWANNINASLSTIDSHDHTAGKGVQITPNAININSDLSFQTYNATNLNSTRYVANVAPLAAISPNLQCLYVSGVDLYYNDGLGNQIRLTQSGAVSGSAGTITGLPSGTASAAFSAINGTFTFQQATATAANMDVGTVTIRYPGSYPAPVGNFISIKAPTTLATGYSLTLPTNTPGVNPSFIVSDTAGALSYVSQVQTNSIADLAVTTAKIADLNVTTAKIADLNVTTAKIQNAAVTRAKLGAVGPVGAASSGYYANGTGTNQTIPNQSITITTTGRPVMLMCLPFAGAGSYIAANLSYQVNFDWIRDGVAIGTIQIIYGPMGPANLNMLDYNAGAGTHTYSLKISNQGIVNNIQILAYEL